MNFLTFPNKNLKLTKTINPSFHNNAMSGSGFIDLIFSFIL